MLGAFVWLLRGGLPVYFVAASASWILALLGLWRRVRVTPAGLEVQLALFGRIPLWPRRAIAWDDVGALRAGLRREGGARVAELSVLGRSGGGVIERVPTPSVAGARWLARRLARFAGDVPGA